MNLKLYIRDDIFTLVSDHLTKEYSVLTEIVEADRKICEIIGFQKGSTTNDVIVYSNKYMPLFYKNYPSFNQTRLGGLFFKEERVVQLLYILLFNKLPREDFADYDSVEISKPTKLARDNNNVEEELPAKRVIISLSTRYKVMGYRFLNILKSINDLRNDIMHNSLYSVYYRYYLVISFIVKFTELYAFKDEVTKNLLVDGDLPDSNKFNK